MSARDAVDAAPGAPPGTAPGLPPELPPAERGAARLKRIAWAWLGIGLALRLMLAWVGLGGVAEWEADGFVLGWEGRPWASWNRARPPFHAWGVHGLVDALGLGTVREVRLLWVGVSVLALLAACDLLRVLARSTRSATRRHALALCWLLGAWALLPTLIVASTSPTPETPVGGLLCLCAAALLRFRERAGLLRWIWLTVTAAACLGWGGLVVALPLLLALLVYLAPVPRLGVSLPLLLAAAVACGAAWYAQRGPDPTRPWLPDAAPAYALGSLVDAPFQFDDREPVDPDRRAARVWSTAATELSGTPGLDLAGRLAQRLLVDQLSPRRFEALTSVPVLPVGLLDAYLRGGMLLFVAATLALSRRSDASAAPRAAAAVGLAALGLCAVLGGVGPFALASFDLLVLAVGATGLVGADPHRPRPRWIAFAIGGLMLSGLCLWSMASGRSLSPWARQLMHSRTQGRALVETLAVRGTANLQRQVDAAFLLMDPSAPFLRLPDAARAHADAAVRLAPMDETALRMRVQAEVEAVQLQRAEEIARTLVGPDGKPSPDAKVLLDWVLHKRRQWRNEGGA